MPINFPDTPLTIGQQYPYDGTTWQWNGSAWIVYATITSGSTGATGPQGNTGATGATGPVGDYVSKFNGMTGDVTGVTVGGINVFTALNTFNSGISSAGGTFSSQTRFLAGITVAGGATFGTDISVFGIKVGRGNQGATNGGDTNLAVGANTLNVVVPNPAAFAGIYNLAFGTSALQSTSSGGYNSAFGTEALLSNTSGGGNIAFGVHALRLNTSGAENCAFGGGPMYQNTTGGYNVAIGSLSYYYKSTGSYNVAIGFQAGYNFGTPRSGSTVTSATNCTLIGTYATPLSSGTTNEIVIGYDAIGKGSNTVSIGNSSITATHLTGIVNNPSGLSAADATFSGTLSGATGTFSRLLTASSGISASGATFSGNISAPNIVNSFNGNTGAVTGVTVGGTNVFTALNSFNAGISAAGGVTFSGNFSGATGSFSRLLTASGGISASNATFSSDVYANASLFTNNIFDINGIVSINDKASARVAIGDYSSNVNSTFIYLRDNLSILDISNPYGDIKIGDPGAVDSGYFISYNAAGGYLDGGGSALTNWSTGSFSQLLSASAGISAAGGVTFSGNVNLQDNTLSRIELLDYCERFVDLGDHTSAGTQIPINLSTGQVFRTKLTATSTGLNVTNTPDNGNANAVGFSLLFVGDGTARTMTWNIGSTAAAWAGGIAPTYTSTSNKIDVYSFLSRDGGSTWLGFVGGQNF